MPALRFNQWRAALPRRRFNLDGDMVLNEPISPIPNSLTVRGRSNLYASDALTLQAIDSAPGNSLYVGYKMRTETKRIDGTDPNISDSFIQTTVTHKNLVASPNYRYSVERNSLGTPLGTQLQTGDTDSNVTLSQPLGYDVRFAEDGIGALSYGTYQFIAYHGYGSGAQTTTVRETFQLRAIEITGFESTSPFVDLNVSNPKVDMKGSITVYPNMAHQGIAGWTPTASSASYRIRIGHPDLDPSDWIVVDGTATTSAPDNEGVVANILEEDIDLTPLVTAFASLSPARPLPDILLAEARAIMDTEDDSNTVTPLARACISDDDRELRKDPCQPPWSCNPYGLPNFQGAATSGVPEASQRFTGNNRLDPAGSMGGGWQLGAYKKLEEDDDGNLTFHDGNGMIERWLPEGSDYLPAHKDNRIKAEKSGSTFTLTLLDNSVMVFDEENPSKVWKLKTWTDANGVVTTYTYDSSTDKRLISVNDGLGRQTNFNYASPSDRQPSSISSHTGAGSVVRTTSFTYHSSGQLATMTNPEGEVTSYTYTGDSRIQSVTDPIGVAVAYTYYLDGRVHTETYYGERELTYTYHDANMKITIMEEDLVGSGGTRTTVYHYDDYRNIIKIVDPLDNETLREFKDPHDPFLLTSVATPNGTTRYSYNELGLVTSVTDAYLNRTRIEYGNSSFPLLPTAVVRPASGGRTEMTYDGGGNLLTVKDALNQTSTMTYDGDGFMLTSTDRNGHTTEFTYGGSPKNLTSVKTPKEGGGFRTVFFEYDGFDNVTRAYETVLGQEVNVTFDKLDRAIEIEDARGHVTNFNFDPVNGLLETIVSPVEMGGVVSTRETAMTYDSSGRLEEVFRDLSSSTQTSRVKYEFDGFSQLKKLIRKKHSNASKAYEFTYDILGRAKTAKDTENKTTTTNYAPFCLRQATDSARGIRTVQHFDSLCRLVKVEVGTAHPTDPLDLDTVTESRDFVYDDLSRLVSSTQKAVNFSGSAAKYGVARFGVSSYSASSEDGLIRTYHYDVLDRLTSVVFEDGKTASFEYWPEGQLKKMTDPDGKVTLYEYHPNGSLAKVKLERGGSVVGEFVYAYDAVGLPESITYPTETGVVAWFKSSSNARGWNENGQLLHLRYLKGGVPIREFEFDYDAAGNRIKQVDISSAGAFEWKYSYDYLDRLTKVEKKTGAGPLLEMSIYAYDESDNRTVLELPQDVVKFIYGYDDADQITTMEKRNRSTNALILTETFGSDDDGNVISRFNDDTGVTISYGWDSFNKLVAVSSSNSSGPTNDAKQENSYLANGFRRKKKAKSGAVTTEYSAGLSTAMAKVGSDPISYIQGHHILGFEKGGSYYWYLTDHLGSVRDIVSGTDGAVLQSYDYRENGEKTASTSLQSDKTWVGGLSVNDDTADSGLYLMGHRHFDSTTGRFLSRDPIGFAGGLNLYSYAGSSPVGMVDPEGLRSLIGVFTESAVKSFVIGAVGTVAVGAGLAAGTIGGGLAAGALLTVGIAGAGIGLAYAGAKIVSGQWTAEDTAEMAGGMVGGYGGNRFASALRETPGMMTMRRPCNDFTSPMDPFSNPRMLQNMKVSDVVGYYSRQPGWKIGRLGRGRHQGEGITIRQLAPNGNDVTDLLIQWHPGSVRHFGGKPYWKVSQGGGGSDPVTRFEALGGI